MNSCFLLHTSQIFNLPCLSSTPPLPPPPPPTGPVPPSGSRTAWGWGSSGSTPASKRSARSSSHMTAPSCWAGPPTTSCSSSHRPKRGSYGGRALASKGLLTWWRQFVFAIGLIHDLHCHYHRLCILTKSLTIDYVENLKRETVGPAHPWWVEGGDREGDRVVFALMFNKTENKPAIYFLSYQTMQFGVFDRIMAWHN